MDKVEEEVRRKTEIRAYKNTTTKAENNNNRARQSYNFGSLYLIRGYMPKTIKIVRKYYAIDENRNIVAEGNSWEEVEEIMKRRGYKRNQYDILTVVEAENV